MAGKFWQVMEKIGLAETVEEDTPPAAKNRRVMVKLGH